MSKLSPEQIKLLNGLAVLQISCGRPSAALPFLNLSYHLASEEAHTCYLLANVYHRMGQTDRSTYYLEKYEAIQARGLTGRALLLKSIIATRSGAIAEARVAFKGALKKITRINKDDNSSSEAAAE